MKLTTFTKRVFEFTDLKRDVPHPYTQGARKAEINSVTLVWTEYDEPQEELEGDTIYFDYRFYGFECKENGQIDKRQKRAGLTSFPRALDALNFIAELIESIPNDPQCPKHEATKLLMGNYVATMIASAKEREQQQLQRLLDR